LTTVHGSEVLGLKVTPLIRAGLMSFNPEPLNLNSCFGVLVAKIFCKNADIFTRT